MKKIIPKKTIRNNILENKKTINILLNLKPWIIEAIKLKKKTEPYLFSNII